MSDETFEHAEDAIQAVKATVDDVDSVTVLFNRSLAGQDGEDLSDVGMILNYCTGRHGFVSRSLTAFSWKVQKACSANAQSDRHSEDSFAGLAQPTARTSVAAAKS
jgi:hypothetical protein